MKKPIYITGMICLSIILIATIFKVSHFQGANILILIGVGAITFIFLPIVYSMLLKSTDDELLRFVFTTALISFFIDFIGMAFKILHWPGAGILLIIGIPLPFILFLPAYVRYHNKRKLKTNVNFFALVSFMIYLGIFSSLLAMDVSRNYLDAYAHSANNIVETNQYLKNQLKKNSESSVSTHEMLNQLESMKQKLILISNGQNNQLHEEESDMCYFDINNKSLKISYNDLANIGFVEFNQQFEDYCQNLSNFNGLIKRLIDEINTYRLAESKNIVPIIAQLRLITVLNVLTDWQNKILLIEYTNLKQQNDSTDDVVIADIKRGAIL